MALFARLRPDRLERAAIRWHGRLEVEAQVLTPVALARLPADPQAHAILKKLLRQANPTHLRQLS